MPARIPRHDLGWARRGAVRYSKGDGVAAGGYDVGPDSANRDHDVERPETDPPDRHQVASLARGRHDAVDSGRRLSGEPPQSRRDEASDQQQQIRKPSNAAADAKSGFAHRRLLVLPRREDSSPVFARTR